MTEKIGIIGAGSWGTGLALLLSRNGYDVELWCHGKKTFEFLNREGENETYLPGFEIPQRVTPVMDFERAVADKSFVLWVVPTKYIRELLERQGEHFQEDTIVLSASKGVENETFLTPTGIIEEVVDVELETGVLTGPSFAREVAQKQPTAVVTAFEDIETAKFIQKIFSCENFRVYASTDVRGAQLGGALKNVIAIASGIIKGLGYGHNTTAGLITRGLTEITRLAVTMGAKKETLMGLAGMGDLVLTCTGGLSRNLTFGKRIGSGEAPDEIIDSMKMVAEGVKTTRSVHNLAVEKDVEMPITREMYNILYENKSPRDSVETLMKRAPKIEGVKALEISDD